jgi:hypothetical protein
VGSSERDPGNARLADQAIRLDNKLLIPMQAFLVIAPTHLRNGRNR